MVNWFNRFDDKCDYCMKLSKKKYCTFQCCNRAGVLRNGVHRSKQMPKNINQLDNNYLQDYVDWLHLSRENCK